MQNSCEKQAKAYITAPLVPIQSDCRAPRFNKG